MWSSLRKILCVFFLLQSCNISIIRAKRVADDKYYKLLGVSTSADDKQLKKAYRELALKWHPDKHASGTEDEKKIAEAKFAEISVAYDTLSNPEKRKLYDQVGEDGIKQGAGQGGGGGGGFPGGIDPQKIFEKFFGGGGFPGGASFSSQGGTQTFTFTMGGDGGGFGGGGGGGPEQIFSQFLGGGGGGGPKVQQQEASPQGIFDETEESIDKIGKKEFKKLIEGVKKSGSKTQFLAILYNGNDDEETKNLIELLVKIAKQYKVVKSAIPWYAADCSAMSKVCQSLTTEMSSLVHVVGDGLLESWSSNGENSGHRVSSLKFDISVLEKHLNKFLNTKIVDKCKYLKSMTDKDKYLNGNSQAAKVVLLTDKGNVPPIVKGLSLELADKVEFGVASRKLDEAAFRSFSYPSTDPLPIFYDVQSGKFAKKSSTELRPYLVAIFKSFQILKKQAKFTSLTADALSSGTCGPADYRFCLILFVKNKAAAEQYESSMLAVAKEFKKANNDPLRTHYVEITSENEKLLRKMSNLLQGVFLEDKNEEEEEDLPGKSSILPGCSKEDLFAKCLGDNSAKAILWRPKRRRWQSYRGDLTKKEDILSFTSGAIDGGSQLGMRHEEL